MLQLSRITSIDFKLFNGTVSTAKFVYLRIRWENDDEF